MISYRNWTPFQVAFRGLIGSLSAQYSTGPYIHPNPLVQPKGTTKKFKAKHANPKFKAERGMKVVKVKLPDFHEKKEKHMSPEQIRKKMKEHGLQPPRPWDEKPLHISATSIAFEPYVPPEGDGKASVVTKEGAKQKLEFVEKKGKSMMAVRKIRQFDEDFHMKDFCEEAQSIYVKMHEALTRLDEDALHRLATERAFPLAVRGLKGKTLRWGWHGSVEPPRVVHARYTDIVTKENIFAQLTVRFHTQQTLAVYDRFGHLLHGSETLLKDVLEYVVFEKHLSNVYGAWRVHDKILPPWMKRAPATALTFKSALLQEGGEGAAVSQ